MVGAATQSSSTLARMPRLLDLFSGAGGASAGYARAGFEVVGVDLHRQPNYPYTFVRADAITLDIGWLRTFDAIHASPPCQRYSAMSACRPGLAAAYPDLIDATRALCEASGLPYVLENVPGSPLRTDAVLCGQMFGLELYRHRVFESNVPITTPDHPRHVIPGSRAGHWEPGQIISVSGHCSPMALARKAMGIDWMSRSELAEAIPPAYTEWIGRQLDLDPGL
jgi:DNA (cytosine-5)-methyltransferase 1